MGIDFIFQIAILILSVVVHEVAHGYSASFLGDQTARYQGRLTLNPAKHLDPVGSFLVPTASYLLGGFIIGWAKPVPYNPHNLRPGRWSEAWVALAGPAVNLSLALVFGLLLRFFSPVLNQGFVEITIFIVFINLILAVFNMMPIPPLDGSKVLFALFHDNFMQIREFFERYGLILILLFIFFLWRFVLPVAFVIFKFITGSSVV